MRFYTQAIIIAVLWIALSLTAGAEERILSFHSDITVHENSSMTVVETIRVRAEGDQIKRGIYRDVPTTYKDRTGHKLRVGFSVRSVQKNGQSEPYAVEPLGNGQRVRIGQADVFLPPGEYTYAITYDTSMQLGYFEDHDELYWNVTGVGWDFVIESASAQIGLPEGIDIETLAMEGYTGPEGETGQDYETSVVEGKYAHFSTTRPLEAREGLTVVVSWPKGHVVEPTQKERLMYLLRDNRSAMAALIGLCMVLAYYSVVWILVGRDPAKGAIIPRTKPPDGISPGAARFIRKMGYDHRCLVAALIHLGVKGRLRLKEEDGEYSIQRLDPNAGGVSREETALFKKLLGRRSSLTFKNSNHEAIGKAVDAYKTGLSAAYEKVYFLTNTSYWVPGIVMAPVTLAATVWYGSNPAEGLFMGVWLSVWSIGVLALAWAVVQAWKNTLTGPKKITDGVGAIFITAFATPFFIGEAVGIYMLSRATSPLAMLLLVTLVLTVLAFYHFMKAPTLMGRRLMDEIEGFRLYLSATKEDRLRRLNAPQQTRELFETYLPYALALDVEENWAEYFDDVLKTDDTEEGPAYHSAWYDSSHGRYLGAGAIAAAVGGSLASAISSSSTAPGSSSGSGGGGSSGGGGGGGGGGGW